MSQTGRVRLRGFKRSSPGMCGRNKRAQGSKVAMLPAILADALLRRSIPKTERHPEPVLSAAEGRRISAFGEPQIRLAHPLALLPKGGVSRVKARDRIPPISPPPLLSSRQNSATPPHLQNKKQQARSEQAPTARHIPAWVGECDEHQLVALAGPGTTQPNPKGCKPDTSPTTHPNGASS